MFRVEFYVASFQDALSNVQKGGLGRTLTTTDALIVITAGVGVVGLLVLWLVFFRKKPKQERHPLPEPRMHEEDEPRRRRRRRRRAHRPRNPTLHQTGGLPPQRSDDAPPHTG
jgi:hypothetical protein